MFDRGKPPRVCPVHKSEVPDGMTCGVDGCRFGAGMTEEETAAQRESWVRGEMGMGETVADKVVSLNAQRAEASGDCRDWSVTDMLEEALQDVATERWEKGFVFLVRENYEANELEHRVKAAGATTLEMRGMMLTMLMSEILK